MAQLHVRIPDRVKVNGNEMLMRLGKTPSSYINENYRKLADENIKIKRHKSVSSSKDKIRKLKSEIFHKNQALKALGLLKKNGELKDFKKQLNNQEQGKNIFNMKNAYKW